jgi:hypothetical protein
VFSSLYYTHGTVPRTATKEYNNKERISREDWADISLDRKSEKK